jgi:hypothetical protein
MNGARFVHDRLEEGGWDLQLADIARRRRTASTRR